MKLSSGGPNKVLPTISTLRSISILCCYFECNLFVGFLPDYCKKQDAGLDRPLVWSTGMFFSCCFLSSIIPLTIDLLLINLRIEVVAIKTPKQSFWRCVFIFVYFCLSSSCDEKTMGWCCADTSAAGGCRKTILQAAVKDEAWRMPSLFQQKCVCAGERLDDYWEKVLLWGKVSGKQSADELIKHEMNRISYWMSLWINDQMRMRKDGMDMEYAPTLCYHWLPVGNMTVPSVHPQHSSNTRNHITL